MNSAGRLKPYSCITVTATPRDSGTAVTATGRGERGGVVWSCALRPLGPLNHCAKGLEFEGIEWGREFYLVIKNV
jgi:hypothetical protein